MFFTKEILKTNHNGWKEKGKIEIKHKESKLKQTNTNPTVLSKHMHKQITSIGLGIEETKGDIKIGEEAEQGTNQRIEHDNKVDKQSVWGSLC